jgi:hypothetical protein
MKKTILAGISLLFVFACSEKKTDKNFEISGTIKGLKKGTLYIQHIVDTSVVTIDTIQIDGNSTFSSAFDLKSPEMLYLYLDRGTSNTIDNRLQFFAEPGKLNIETDLDLFYANAKITGSKNQELYENYKKIASRYNEEQLALTEERFKAIKSKNQEAIALNDTKNDAILKRKYLFAINFAVNNKNYDIAPYIALSEINNATIPYLDTINNSLSKKVAQSKYGILLKNYIAERRKTE